MKFHKLNTYVKTTTVLQYTVRQLFIATWRVAKFNSSDGTPTGWRRRAPKSVGASVQQFNLVCERSGALNIRLIKAHTYGCQEHTLVSMCVVRLLFVLFYELFVCKCVLPPGDNPIAVNKYININTAANMPDYHGQPVRPSSVLI